MTSMTGRTTVNADLLKTLMADRKLTQEQLAVAAGITTATLNNINKGGVFKSATLDAIANVLEVDPRDLMRTEGFPSPRLQAPSTSLLTAQAATA